jgi:curved DNA-binding protein
MAVGDTDHYETLGVPRSASEDEIRSAYRKLARQHHPDVNKEPGAADRFKAISEAHDVLRDKERRAAYDRYGSNWRAAQQAEQQGYRPPPRGNGGRPSDAFGGGTRVDFEEGDISDIFEGFFGSGFTRRPRTREAVLELPLEEAARGGRRRLSLDGEEVEVVLPAGVTDGQRIRVPDADLVLEVRLRRHPRFRVDGRDLYTDLPIAPWEAALGAEVEVQTLDGRARVKVPPGSSSGRKLRLRGQGLGGGDLYATVKIVVPKKLTKKERELFEQLAKTSKFNPRKGG